MIALDVISDIRGRQLECLLRELASQAESVGFVIQGQISQDALALMRQIESDKIRDAFVQEWPGTILLGGQSRLLEYTPSDDVLCALIAFAGSLFDWSRQSSPEDLFIRSGKNFLLESTGHEQQATLRTPELTPLFAGLQKEGVILARTA